MEQAIKKAIEGGWVEASNWKFKYANKYWAIWLNGNGDMTTIDLKHYQLNPLFWQALGKAMGWGKYEKDRSYPRTWKDYQHVFIDAIQDGKDADSFFNQLLK